MLYHRFLHVLSAQPSGLGIDQTTGLLLDRAVPLARPLPQDIQEHLLPRSRGGGGAEVYRQPPQLGQPLPDAAHQRRPHAPRDGHTQLAVGKPRVLGLDALQEQVVLEVREGELHAADLCAVRVRLLHEEAVGVLRGGEDQRGGLEEGLDRLGVAVRKGQTSKRKAPLI